MNKSELYQRRAKTWERNENIRVLYHTGLREVKIATFYELSRQRIHQIINSNKPKKKPSLISRILRFLRGKK